MAIFYKKSSQLGRSMIEMLGVLAIIGVLSIGSIAGYTKAMEKYNINKLKDQFAVIMTNLTTLLANGQNSSQLANLAVIDALHILPQEMGSSYNCRHALGGRCYISGSGQDGAISIRILDLPKSACVEMATLDVTFANRSTVINAKNTMVLVSENCVNEEGESTCEYRKVRSTAEAMRACKGEKNAVIFLFGLKL